MLLWLLLAAAAIATACCLLLFAAAAAAVAVVVVVVVLLAFVLLLKIAIFTSLGRRAGAAMRPFFGVEPLLVDAEVGCGCVHARGTFGCSGLAGNATGPRQRR